MGSRGPAPFSLPPINRGVRGGHPHHPPRRSPPLPNTSPPPLCAWRSPVGVLPLHHHHAVVLPVELSSSTSPSPLLDQEGGDVSRPVRVLNTEVPSVRRWSSVIWITASTTPSSPFSRTLPHAIYKMVCRCNLSPMTRCLDELIDGSW